MVFKSCVCCGTGHSAKGYCVSVPNTKEVPKEVERTESKELKASLSEADSLSVMAFSKASRKFGSAARRYSQYRLAACVFGCVGGTVRGGRIASTNAFSDAIWGDERPFRPTEGAMVAHVPSANSSRLERLIGGLKLLGS